MSAPSNAVPRLRTLYTNAKKLRCHQYKTSSNSTTLESTKSDGCLLNTIRPPHQLAELGFCRKVRFLGKIQKFGVRK